MAETWDKSIQEFCQMLNEYSKKTEQLDCIKAVSILTKTLQQSDFDRQVKILSEILKGIVQNIDEETGDNIHIQRNF